MPTPTANRSGSPTRLVCLALALLAVAAAAIGCGTDEPTLDESDRTTPLPGGFTLASAPEMSETAEQAVERIEELVSSGDCKQIYELNPLTRPGLATESRCNSLRALAGLPVQDVATYGDVAAVVDYERGGRTVSALLVGDSDGRFHVAFIDPFLGVPSVGTDPAPQLDRAAEQAVEALRKRDCERFLAVAYRRFGVGGGTDEEVCERVEANPVPDLIKAGAAEEGLRVKPDYKLERLGGNGSYGFYGLRTGGAYVIVIAARQTERGVPEGMPAEVARLPAGAPEYGFLDAIRVQPD